MSEATMIAALQRCTSPRRLCGGDRVPRRNGRRSFSTPADSVTWRGTSHRVVGARIESHLPCRQIHLRPLERQDLARRPSTRDVGEFDNRLHIVWKLTFDAAELLGLEEPAANVRRYLIHQIGRLRITTAWPARLTRPPVHCPDEPVTTMDSARVRGVTIGATKGHGRTEEWRSRLIGVWRRMRDVFEEVVSRPCHAAGQKNDADPDRLSAPLRPVTRSGTMWRESVDFYAPGGPEI